MDSGASVQWRNNPQARQLTAALIALFDANRFVILGNERADLLVQGFPVSRKRALVNRGEGVPCSSS